MTAAEQPFRRIFLSLQSEELAAFVVLLCFICLVGSLLSFKAKCRTYANQSSWNNFERHIDSGKMYATLTIVKHSRAWHGMTWHGMASMKHMHICYAWKSVLKLTRYKQMRSFIEKFMYEKMNALTFKESQNALHRIEKNEENYFRYESLSLIKLIQGIINESKDCIGILWILLINYLVLFTLWWKWKHMQIFWVFELHKPKIAIVQM